MIDYVIDSVRFYNDFITVDIGGNTTSTAQGDPVYLRTTGGTEKAVGYYDYSNTKVVLIPSTEITAGSSGLTLELVTDTTSVMIADTTANESLTLSLDLGTPSTVRTPGNAGDFRWYDQATNPVEPITWLNGASPISVSLTY